LFFITYNDVKRRAIKYTENSVVKIPTPRVIENPLTGPEPRKNKIIADINVVILASKIAVFERL
jgi:hypothetical protein